MSTLGIHHVNFHVPQPLLDSMKTFYCDVMDLRVGFRPEFKQSGYWLYAGTVPVVHLYEAVGTDIRATGVTSVYDHVAFHCTDLADVRSRLERLSVPYSIVELAHSGEFQIAVIDPAGHKLEFIVAPSQP